MIKFTTSNVTINLATGVVFATYAMFSYAGGSHEGGHDAPHWMAPEEAAAIPNPIKREPESIKRGAEIFANNCASCHGEKAMGDGSAAVALNPKPSNLVAMAGVHPDGDFAWKIENGRGVMPAWKGRLKENQIWDVVNFIQSLELPDKSKMEGMDHSQMVHSHDNADSHESHNDSEKKVDDHDDSHEHQEPKKEEGSHDHDHDHKD